MRRPPAKEKALPCPAPHAPQSSGPLSVSPRSLAAAFAPVPDPRRQGRVTYALSAILTLTLTLAVAAILAHHLAVLAITAWGARPSPAVLRLLGFPGGRRPCPSPLQRLFRTLAGHALSAALSAPVAPAGIPVPQGERAAGVAVDGQAQRGRLPFQDGGGPLHALTACCPVRGVVLAHEPITPGAEKGAAAVTAAPALLARIAWPGRVLTGDALFCQRQLCQQVLDAGGDDVLLVKETQPTLYNDIRLLFDPPAESTPRPWLDRRAAQTGDRGQGRRDDVRPLVASPDVTAYRDGPGVAPVFRLTRTWRAHRGPQQALP